MPKSAPLRTPRLLWFLRPTLIVVACFALAVLAAHRLSQPGLEVVEDHLAAAQEFAIAQSQLKRPSPEFHPQDVVHIQLAALRNPERSQGALQCMAFASPLNLQVTGPLEKFASVIRAPRFSALSNHEAVLVGTPTFAAGHARVLVTALANDRTSAFVWILTKQDKPPHEGCWLTDAVLSLEEADRGNENAI